jgi:hypothetical protein
MGVTSLSVRICDFSKSHRHHSIRFYRNWEMIRLASLLVSPSMLL